MKKFIISIVSVVLPLLMMGQNVTDVEARQEGRCIVVIYSIDKDSPKVTLHVSTDGGNTYSDALKAVSGDLANVTAGCKTIRWDVLTEREKLIGDKIVFKVIAKPLHEYVDLGLSVKWATCNVGASEPWEYGGYYQWAGTQEVSDTSIYLDYSNCPYHSGSSSKGLTKYVPYDKDYYWSGLGRLDRKTILDFDDDVAHVNWGGTWCMPTDAEWTELRNTDNCSWIWTTINDIKGYKVQSKKPGYTANWIFLPAAGYRYYNYFKGVGSSGSYWSSTLYTSNCLQ